MAQGKDLKRYGGEGEQGLSRGEALNPFSFMRRMMDDIDRMFGGGFGELERSSFSPEVEVFQKEGKLVVRADLPGLDRDDIHVNVEDGALTLSGERKSQHEEEREGYFHSERSYGSFQRTIPLPRGVDASSCDARFDNGVLEISMKLPKESSRRVEIRGGEQRTQQPESAPQPSQRQNVNVQPQNGTPARG